MRVWEVDEDRVCRKMGPIWGTVKVGVERWVWCSQSTKERWKEESRRVLPVG